MANYEAKSDYNLAYYLARNTRKTNRSYGHYVGLCRVALIPENIMESAWNSMIAYRIGNSTQLTLLDRLTDKLVDYYAAKIESDFDWQQLETDTLDNLDTIDYSGEKLGRVYLGSALDLNPSGKYWVVWAASNVNDIETAKDIAFNQALDRIASKYGGWIESGEGDPLDQYFCKSYED